MGSAFLSCPLLASVFPRGLACTLNAYSLSHLQQILLSLLHFTYASGFEFLFHAEARTWNENWETHGIKTGKHIPATLTFQETLKAKALPSDTLTQKAKLKALIHALCLGRG